MWGYQTEEEGFDADFPVESRPLDKELEPEVESREAELQSSDPLSVDDAKAVDACKAEKSLDSPMEIGALAVPQPSGAIFVYFFSGLKKDDISAR